MTALFGRQVSKFRNVLGQDPKTHECWSELRLSAVSGEQSYIKCNGKFFAVALQVGLLVWLYVCACVAQLLSLTYFSALVVFCYAFLVPFVE